MQLPTRCLLSGWLLSSACAVILAQSTHHPAVDGEESVTLGVVTPDARRRDALAAVLRAALEARGLRASVAAAPAECEQHGYVAPECRRAAVWQLRDQGLHAAVLAVPAAHPPPLLLLRDRGLEEMGDAAPALRLNCAVTDDLDPRPRSLLDFTDPELAARYNIPANELSVLTSRECGSVNSTEHEESAPWCERDLCGTLLTGEGGEAHELAREVERHRLHVRVRALGGACLARVGLAAPRALLLCARGLDTGHLRPLGAPPCLHSDINNACIFDPYRFIKLVNARKLAYSPIVSKVLGSVNVTEAEVRELMSTDDVTAAARALVAQHNDWTSELRVTVMIPASTRREAYDAHALLAAAALAEHDTKHNDDKFVFKVELKDDACSANKAFEHLTAASKLDYTELTGVVGPACGAAFADVSRQTPTLRLPTLAYTAQPPPGDAPLSLLTAGDARQYTRAWLALAARLHWRRVAVLTELPLDLQLDIILQLHLAPDRDQDQDLQLITEWAERVSELRGRVVLLNVEDARVVRAALCAGQRAGLRPRAGAVWLLPAGLPARWLTRRPSDAHGCTDAELREAAEAHLSVAPAWLVDWDPDGSDDGRAWAARWRDQCLRHYDAELCVAPDVHSAVLYDALRLWHATLRRVLRDHPAALNSIHSEATVGALVRDATTGNYSGVTGRYEWAPAGGGVARAASLVLRQWSNGTTRRAAEWRPGAGLTAVALHWLTDDGRVPDDGTEICTLQPLADLLHSDCRTAFVSLGALVALLLVAGLGAAAYQCKRRAEREYRRRLAALGLRDLSLKPGGLDRWEMPRERVVINRKLGTGAFGTVYGGHALLGEDRGWSAVAVKTLKAGADTAEKLDFLSEAEAMKRFEHKNVVRLLGVVTKTEPVCTVMEFMLYGDLKNYLLARRHLAAEHDEVSAARLSAMALDVARALSYLAQLRYVHRDVAARNCLVGASRVVKLADFGMTRPVFESDYYRFSRKGMLPVRWMAPESLALGVFSPASDVWSFGVLLYEIVTFGSLPYQGLSNAEVLARVKGGHALDLPAGLKPQLVGLIKSCWSVESKSRPSAAEVAAFLAEWPRLLAPCLELPLDALVLDAPWQAGALAEARWLSWAAPSSTTTDTTYLSTDAPPSPPLETDSFLSPH